MAKVKVVLPLVFFLLLFIFEAGAVPLPPLGPDGRYSQTPEELLAFALSFYTEIKQSDDKESTELKKLLNQLDISNKILQWVQGLKLLAPGAVVFVVWAFKSSPGLWATRAKEAKGFTDIELGVLGRGMANSKLFKLTERMDRMDEQMISDKEDAAKKMKSIIARVDELDRGRAGSFDSHVRNRGGIHQRSPSPRKVAGEHAPEVAKDL
ncbi:hypothetical protein N7509_009206 [Penicillium cosmopolitanum]|uniref:Transmembrane protein n=1 Tax=Penicillium cosmopolitanum TaxID=1131564 RepID=A0A9W9VP56_9EURO|nr:uncharacterized protein N7509_009206 [Penicillium cosmopolitanum]KAJ5386665.1 hypothetical protein N7509_009206 [Penicillium cosmopolitanum]